MGKQVFTMIAILLMVALLPLGGGIAFAVEGSANMSPELAAKTENIRKQQKQRITPAQRQAAAQALKLRREKLHKAQQSAPQPAQSAPVTQ